MRESNQVDLSLPQQMKVNYGKGWIIVYLGGDNPQQDWVVIKRKAANDIAKVEVLVNSSHKGVWP